MKTSGVATLGLLGSGTASADSNAAGKTRTTVFTETERQAALENIQRYDWAKEERDAAVDAAETALDTYTLEDLWRYVGGQNIPRALELANGNAGYQPPESDWGAPTDASVDVAYYTVKPDRKWKITNGEYTLPTNDFEAYRRSGLNDEGKFDPDLADDQYLVNEEHPEMGEGWGVDDGLGWVDEDGDLGPAGTRWVPVAWWHHWYGVYGYRGIVNALFRAYLYTGERKYATPAAVLLDRIADNFPDWSLQDTVYFEESGYTYLNGFPNGSHGGTGKGKQLGSIWSAYWTKSVLESYDAVWPGMDDNAELTGFLSSMADEYPGIGDKSSVRAIRSNIEENFVKQILPDVKSARIRRSFPGHQQLVALSAVVQDEPDGYTGEALDWTFQAGELVYEDDGTPWGNWYITGGDILASLLSTFDRDGWSDTTSPEYSSISINYLQEFADVLNGYDAYAGADLYGNPLLKSAFERQHHIVNLNEYVPRIGDQKSAGAPGFDGMLGVDNLVTAFETYGGDELAQWLYLRNGNSLDGLQGDIFDPDPNSVTNDIQRVLDAEGPLDLSSTLLAGHGFTGLRAGDPQADTARGVWTYYGQNGHGAPHSHIDKLNLGVFAHGLNLAPDLGYPEETGSWPKRDNWTSNTISHNTVVVNEQGQDRTWVSTPIHFDHTDRVQVSGVDASNAYPEAETYERTTAQITVDDENSYAVDFFRVDGGDDHHFSFHGLSIPEEKSVSLAPGVGQFGSSGSQTIEPTTADAYVGEESIRVIDRSTSADAANGLYQEIGSTDFEASVYVKSAVEADDVKHHEQHVYLGDDQAGDAVFAGVGNPGGSNDPRLGVRVGGSWVDHKSISNWDKDRWYELAVSKTGTAVDVEFRDPDDDSVVAAGSFTLPSDTDANVGFYGKMGSGQTGNLYFDEFGLAGHDDVVWFAKSGRSTDAVAVEGLDLVAQNRGTYAGSDVPKPGHGENTQYNEDVGNGFNYLYNVERDDDPDGSFSVDWDIEDFWDARDDDADVHMRLTMLTDCDDVAVCDGNPPQRWENPETFKYLVAHRTGKDVSSVFTSVIEPYVENRFVESVSEVSVESDDPTARAVKVELTTGRTDYVASASDHEAEHEVADAFTFVGAFAVYSQDANGAHEHAYVHDGKLLIADGDQLVQKPQGRFEGTVEDFTRELTLDNEIDVKIASGPGGNGAIEAAAGECIYVQDTAEGRNGAYEIEGVETGRANRATLDVGERTTVKEFEDPANPGQGYVYIPNEGSPFYIPLSGTWSA